MGVEEHWGNQWGVEEHQGRQWGVEEHQGHQLGVEEHQGHQWGMEEEHHQGIHRRGRRLGIRQWGLGYREHRGHQWGVEEHQERRGSRQWEELAGARQIGAAIAPAMKRAKMEYFMFTSLLIGRLF